MFTDKSTFISILILLFNLIIKGNFINYANIDASRGSSDILSSIYNKNKDAIYQSMRINGEGCEVLNNTYKTGIYIFEYISSELNLKNRSYNQRYCIIRENTSWTVIQKRENHKHQSFNLTWFDYKNGFGDLNQDFWFGNDFISMLSLEKDLILRIELEDFKGNFAWGEYKTFKVLSEDDNYQLLICDFRGNASDSLSSHNGSYFSTFDRKNDNAPICCPCAEVFGGGWWFNSCFESNLNGVFYEIDEQNGYFGGIIWEQWLGNYSLKKSLIMVRDISRQQYAKSSPWPYYEDP